MKFLEFMVNFYMQVIGYLATLGVGFIWGYIFKSKERNNNG